MIIAVDAAKEMKIVGVWGRFELKEGGFSCNLIIGRHLLSDENSTIPKTELDALTMGSNLGWIVRQALEKWVTSYIMIGDSRIALCWVTSEKKRLSLFHRNRCIQIRRGTDLQEIFHVSSSSNPADLGTRPETVKDSDVGPNSRWEKGLPWMKESIDKAVETGILTPVSKLRLCEEEKEAFDKGMVFEKTKEILTRGHPTVLLSTRIENVKSRSEFSDYLLSPTKFKFEKVIRIYATVFRFIRSFKCLKARLKPVNKKFQIFVSLNGAVAKFQNGSEMSINKSVSLPVVTSILTVTNEKNEKQVLKVFDDKYKENIIHTENLDEVMDVHRISALDYGSKEESIMSI